MGRRHTLLAGHLLVGAVNPRIVAVRVGDDRLQLVTHARVAHFADRGR